MKANRDGPVLTWYILADSINDVRIRWQDPIEIPTILATFPIVGHALFFFHRLTYALNTSSDLSVISAGSIPSSAKARDTSGLSVIPGML